MLVVAGGWGDTVELLPFSTTTPSLTASAWQAAPRLPYGVNGARMTAVAGRLFLTGGYDGNTIRRAGEC